MNRTKIFGVALILLLGISATKIAVKGNLLADAAVERSSHIVSYAPGYVSLDYPNGDVPEGTGVCTDVVIRTYRNGLGIDLQKLIHEDMKNNFDAYPSNRLWGLTSPDKNIDHRRTQNQECFFKRKGAKLLITDEAKDYHPGDIVYWGEIASGHVGVVTNKYTSDSIPMVVHNIGYGPQLEDFLFEYTITGHYRWYGGE
jgi:uncharacterized protein YijF (DUF1287 family)